LFETETEMSPSRLRILEARDENARGDVMLRECVSGDGGEGTGDVGDVGDAGDGEGRGGATEQKRESVVAQTAKSADATKSRPAKDGQTWQSALPSCQNESHPLSSANPIHESHKAVSPVASRPLPPHSKEGVSAPDRAAQVVSRQRVADHGEVFTAEREVNAMLELVKHEFENVDSRFLEPACGTGNFLDAILRRKLDAVTRRHKRSRDDFEWHGVRAVASLYGIELLEDNVARCRERLLGVFREVWSGVFGGDISERCERALRFILTKNIICGDALTLRRPDAGAAPLVFSEWGPIGGCWMQRRDYKYEELMPGGADAEGGLFVKYSDTGTRAFIPIPLKRVYPKTHYLEVCDGDE